MTADMVQIQAGEGSRWLVEQECDGRLAEPLAGGAGSGPQGLREVFHGDSIPDLG